MRRVALAAAARTAISTPIRPRARTVVGGAETGARARALATKAKAPAASAAAAAAKKKAEDATQASTAPAPTPAPTPASETTDGAIAAAKKTDTSSASGDAHKTLALAQAIKKIDSMFGKNTVMKLGSLSTSTGDIPVVPTGSLTLDDAIGVGGLPLGRVVEIFGPEASGKTSLALSVIAQAQRAGGRCAFIDAEHALDPNMAKAMGVDVAELYIAQPDSGEAALEITDTLVRSGAMRVIVVDSVAALVPRAEIEGEMGDAHMGMQARLMSQALRKITPSLAKANTLLIFINQIRQKIGVVFGNPETTSGGQALKFYASVRLDVRRADVIKDGGQNVGTVHRIKVVKNKVAPPFGVAEFSMRFGKGISKAEEVLEQGLKHGVLDLKGLTYSLASGSPEGARVLGVGRAKVIKAIEDDANLLAALSERVRDARRRASPLAAPGAEDASVEQADDDQLAELEVMERGGAEASVKAG